jgi:hypothetical protein
LPRWCFVVAATPFGEALRGLTMYTIVVHVSVPFIGWQQTVNLGTICASGRLGRGLLTET